MSRKKKAPPKQVLFYAVDMGTRAPVRHRLVCPEGLDLIPKWYSEGYVEDLEKAQATKLEAHAAELQESERRFAEVDSRAQDLHEELGTAEAKVKELEGKLRMSEPLKKFKVVYDEYEETVEAHYDTNNGQELLFKLWDGTVVACFRNQSVLSVVEIK